LVKPDDEDDMDAEREELFGSSVGPQDGGAGNGTSADAAGHAAAAATAEEPELVIDVDACPTQSTAGNKRRRKSTSPVWEHFEEIFVCYVLDEFEILLKF
jgi:hypothetical protein